MARAWIEDLWFTRASDGSKTPTKRHGQAAQWRVRWYDDRRKMRSKSFRTTRARRICSSVPPYIVFGE